MLLIVCYDVNKINILNGILGSFLPGPDERIRDYIFSICKGYRRISFFYEFPGISVQHSSRFVGQVFTGKQYSSDILSYIPQIEPVGIYPMSAGGFSGE